MPQVYTFTNQKLEPAICPDLSRTIAIKLAPSQTLTQGTVLGRATATNLWAPYNNAGAGGLETARAILQYDVVVDAQGGHFFGGQASNEHLGIGQPSALAYFRGDFYTADLTGLDAAALTDLGARVLLGDTIADPNAIVHIP
jgi:head decoration protein D